MDQNVHFVECEHHMLVMEPNGIRLTKFASKLELIEALIDIVKGISSFTEYCSFDFDDI